MGNWTPANITTHLWLDAADASTIYDASSGGSLTAVGGNVGRIEDKSGNARHAIQATSGNRPVRNSSSVSFEDRWLSVPASAWSLNRMLIGVFNSSSSGWGSGGFINIASSPIDNPELRWGIGATGDNCGYYWGGGYAISNTTSYGLATESIHATSVVTGGVLTQWRNGAQTVTGTRTASWSPIDEFTIGKYLLFSAQTGRSGILKELIVCDSSDRQIVEGYLAWKWGLASSLPSDHPYKTSSSTFSNYKYPSLRTTLPVAGYYARLDAGSAATDQFTADGSQDGTLTNGATRSDDSGLAYSFDGTNDHITLSPAILIPATADWTISFWVKPSVTTESTMLSQYTPSDGRLIVRIDTGNYRLFCGGGELTFQLGSASAVANTWAHVCITRSSKTFTFYVNGVNAGSRTDSLTRSILQYKTLIGKRETDGTSENHFTGLLDDIIVWNSVALNTTNIGYLASQRGAIYALNPSGGGPINSQSLVRPAGDYRPQSLVVM